MGYSSDDSIVRVDFFTTGIATLTGKPHMKWKYTEAIKWITWNGAERLDGGSHMLIHDAFLEALEAANFYRGIGMAICLEPYHEWSRPIAVPW